MDLPVAMEPVRPRRSILDVVVELEDSLGWKLKSGVNDVTFRGVRWAELRRLFLRGNVNKCFGVLSVNDIQDIRGVTHTLFGLVFESVGIDYVPRRF